MKKGIIESLAYYLETEGIAERAARAAARKIAQEWEDRNFWASATLTPLTTATPGMSTDARKQLLTRLELRFNVHIHAIAEWDPTS
jgi:hypothetical protein